MSNWHKIKIVKQEGELELDAVALANEPANKMAIGELFAQHGDPAYHDEPMFRVHQGKLQVYDGGYDRSWTWSKQADIWGCSGKELLTELAKHLRGGKVMFLDEVEGCGFKTWEIENGQCVMLG
jgi:hypothetical protein